MKLSQLLKSIEHQMTHPVNGLGEVRITSVHYDSRHVRPGGIFVAVPGLNADGHEFINDAVQRGAVAIVAEKPIQSEVPVVQVHDTRTVLANLAGTFFNHPSKNLTIVGITGTNGKTTTAYILENMLIKAGFKVGVIGTINYRYGGKVFDNPVTTPESLDLQRILADMRADNVSHVVMEVSSHAIDLGRINNCGIDLGVFTNLSQDHLDYHGDMRTYWACKKKLFTEYVNRGEQAGSAAAVVNTRSAQGRELVALLSYPCLTVGHTREDMVHPTSTTFNMGGIRGTLQTPGGDFDFHTPLAGPHNLENILCAAGAGIVLELSLDDIKKGIDEISAVPGRLQRVPGSTSRHVYVDYAHTPDALENILRALRALHPRRLICIFGCGGDRDKTKRPIMGEISGRLSDLTIVTSDNPRTEKPTAIIDEILTGLKNAGGVEYRPAQIRNGWHARGFLVEPDRKRAIRLGVEGARAGDIVVIAGKGHETYQIVGRQTLPFDDLQQARKVLEGRSKGNSG